MCDYASPSIAGLAQQLKRGPRRLRLKQLFAIDFLLTVVDQDHDYPFEFVRHVLTGYRKPQLHEYDENDDPIAGRLLRDGLVMLAEDLSGDAKLTPCVWSEPMSGVNELAERFDVSTKTIFRWRKRGLVAWRFEYPDGRNRIAFPEHCVRRFVAENVALVSRGSSFSQLSKKERAAIVDHARSIVDASEEPLTVNAVAKELANETGRAVETIRLILKHHDEAHPGSGLFNRPALAVPADDQRLAIWEAYVDGQTVAALAERFAKPVRKIYAIVTEMRARELKASKIEYIASDEFAERGAHEILGDPGVADPYDHATAGQKRTPGDLPPYLRQLFELPLLTKAGEQALFRKMNYLRHCAEELRQAIEPEATTAAALDQIDALVEDAEAVKNQIVQANLRLVVSIAKRHASRDRDFFEVVSDGNISLMRAVDKFDYSRGFKFSTYASWAIMKNFARSLPNQRRHQERFQTGREELLGIAPCPIAEETNSDHLPALRARVDRMLSSLEPREADILRHRFGLDAGGESKTLEQIGQVFGVSKERIRQLEARAMAKLRTEFEDTAAAVLE
jgi:RNA polymerase primary sigma factor